MLAWHVMTSVYQVANFMRRRLRAKCCLQVLKSQIDRDRSICELVMGMEEVYSFVDVVRSLPNKLELLEDIIVKILKQTVECAIFIREYTGNGFGGKKSRFSRNADVTDDRSCENPDDLDVWTDHQQAVQNLTGTQGLF